MAPSDEGQHDDSYGIRKSFLLKSRVMTVVSYSDDIYRLRIVLELWWSWLPTCRVTAGQPW